MRGYQRARFSGLTTQGFARVLLEHVIPNPGLVGLYHVSSEPVSKHEALELMNKAFCKNLAIHADTEVVIDRTLKCDRFRAATGFVPPSWPEMVEAMAADQTPYDEWK